MINDDKNAILQENSEALGKEDSKFSASIRRFMLRVSTAEIAAANIYEVR